MAASPPYVFLAFRNPVDAFVSYEFEEHWAAIQVFQLILRWALYRRLLTESHLHVVNYEQGDIQTSIEVGFARLLGMPESDRHNWPESRSARVVRAASEECRIEHG